MREAAAYGMKEQQNTSHRCILVVDDDQKLVEVVRLYLERERYQVLVAYDGITALSLARQAHPCLAILDWMLPHLDGLDLCRLLHRDARLPVILLTAKASEEEMLLGLQQGADDYLTKPFRPRELVARVAAVLRRAYPEAETRLPALSCGELTVDLASHEVWLGAQQLIVTPTEFKLLVTLMREPGRVFSRDDLLRRVSGEDYEAVERTIDVHLMNLRKKIEPRQETPKYIQTVYGVGYKFLREK
jgi:DNA-binding response OmpR family regulator